MGQKFVSYLRVSTQGQGESGLGIKAQRDAVTTYTRQVDGHIVSEFVEIASGKRHDRPQLVAALSRCRQTEAVLLVSHLDRLARSVQFIAGLLESDVRFLSAESPFASRIQLLEEAAFAEEECRRISQRVREALAATQARGVRLGSPTPEVGSAAGVAVLKKQAATRAADVLPIIGAIQDSGIVTLSGIAAALAQRGVPTPRGGEWTPTGVRRVLIRGQETQ